MSSPNGIKLLTVEEIHSQFHTKPFENTPENLYEIKGIQIVHKRRVSKRLYFFDARFYDCSNEWCPNCQKVSFILKYPELELDSIHHIQKNTKLGDKVKIICWVENMTKKNASDLKGDSINNNILFHIKEVEIVEKYDNKIAFIPEIPIIERKGNTQFNVNNQNKNSDNNNTHSEQEISEEKKGICKFWLNGRNCLRGNDCPFLHVTNEELKKQWIDERLNKRKFDFNNKDDFIDPHDKAGHGKRAHVFANWLVEHFGKEFLNSGSGVLDIAGGRGATSFELTVNHKIHSTLFEPRPAKLDKKQMRLLYDLKKKELLKNDQAKNDKNEDSSKDNNLVNLDNNHPMKDNINTPNGNENDTSEKATGNDPNANNIHDEKPKRFKLKKNIKFDIPFPQHQCMVSLDTPNLHRDLFENCSILVGLHPDQATEIIVDLALKLNKPFAIIPCCVFANDFPHRKLKRKKTGNMDNDNEYEDIPVSSYEQFIEYLCEKDKDIQKTFLPFEGKNLLLYKDKSSS